MIKHFISNRALTISSLLVMAQLTLGQPIADKKMSLNVQNASVEKILKEVKSRTGYKVFYNSNLLRGKMATINMQNATVDAILRSALSGTGLTYTIEDGTLVIIPADTNAAPQKEDRQVKGQVLDESGTPLVGAIVRIAGTNKGTTTDSKGNFTLNVPSSTSQIEVSFVGFTVKKINISGKSSVLVHMEEDNKLLNDTYVTGYQTISRERATGSYAVVSEKQIEKRHVTNFSEVLEGLVAGAQASDDGRGGKMYIIRGLGTMIADQAPLIVLDGFPLMDIASSGASANPALSALEKINPHDVESITVLKDAAAASIWGARSANGVIVITTKKAKKDKQLSVNAGTQFSISQKNDINQMLNAATSADEVGYIRSLFANNQNSAYYYGSITDLNTPISFAQMLLHKGYQGQMSMDEMNAQLDILASRDNKQQIKKYLLRNSLVSQTNGQISYGDDKYSTTASVLYQYDHGSMLGEYDHTLMADWNNRFDINKHLAVSVGLNLQHGKNYDTGVTTSDLSSLSPYEMLLNEDGSYASQVGGTVNPDVVSKFYDLSNFAYNSLDYNVLQNARSNKNTTTNTDWRIYAGLEWKDIVKGLNFNTKLQYEQNDFKYRSKYGEDAFQTRWRINEYTACDYDGTWLGGPSALPKGYILSDRKGRYSGLVWRNDLTYNTTFADKHDLSLLAGTELSNYKRHTYSLPYLYGNGTYTPTEAYAQTLTGGTSSIFGVPQEGKSYLSEIWNDNHYVSFYGNASYTYDSRYGVTASARSDASNLITSEAKYRWSPLWSVGALWNISNESWMKDQSLINRLTLRLTYGQNGNACTTSSARTTLSYSSWYDDATGIFPVTIRDYGNPTLRWEKTATTNLGLDFVLFKNHLWGSVEYYDKKGSDILGTVDVASANGTSTATFNNAEMTNRGIEIALGGKIDINRVSVGANVAYSYNRNRISSLNKEVKMFSDLLNAYYVEGYPMSPIFTLDYAGLDERGIPTMSDRQGNLYGFDDFSLYYLTDATDIITYKGTTIAPHTLGFGLNVAYSGFELSAHVNGRFGAKMRMPYFNFSTPSSYYKVTYSAQLGDALAGNTAVPLPGNDIDAYTYEYWGWYAHCLNTDIESADYLYLRDITLSYEFPAQKLRNTFFNRLNIWGKVDNVGLLWTANSKGYHPEYLPGMGIKPALTYTIGVNVNF